MSTKTEKELFEAMATVKQYPADLRDEPMTENEAASRVLELRKRVRNGDIKVPSRRSS